MEFTQSANWILVRLTGSMRRQFTASFVVPLLATLLGCGGQSVTPTSGSTPASAKAGYFSTEPSHATYLPRTDSYCAYRPSNPIHGNRGRIMVRLTTRLSLPLTTGPSRTTGRSGAISETRSPATLPAQRPRLSSGPHASGASTRIRSERLPFRNHIGT